MGSNIPLPVFVFACVYGIVYAATSINETLSFRTDQPAQGAKWGFMALVVMFVMWVFTPCIAFYGHPVLSDARMIILALAIVFDVLFAFFLVPRAGIATTNTRWWEFGIMLFLDLTGIGLTVYLALS